MPIPSGTTQNTNNRYHQRVPKGAGLRRISTTEATPVDSARRVRVASGSDRSIVQRILRGEERAKNEFVVRYGPMIRYVLRSTGVSCQHVDDAYQRVFLLLWDDSCRRLRRWRGEGSLLSFLTTLCSRVAYDDLRSHRAGSGIRVDWEAVSQTLLAPDHLGPDRIFLQRFESEALAVAISALKPIDAELVRRRHLQEESYKEIGIALGMTVSHVGVALMRAEIKLRQQLVSGTRSIAI